MRLLVLDELSKSESALSLNDLEGHFERADRVTLYRTLKTFEKHKLVHRIEDGTGALKYALCEAGCDCAPQDLHAHFHCNKCQSTFCLKDYHLSQMKTPDNFQVEEISLVIKGLCEHCSGMN